MILFPQNLILENERVRLTPVQHTDLPHLLPFALQEPDIWRYSMVSPAGSSEAMGKYLEEAVLQREARKEYTFVVFDKKADRYAGSSRFYDIQLAMGCTQLGYTWYGKQFQQTGLNRHCKLLMLQYAFEQWGMERVEFRAHAGNTRSVEAMKAIGCTPEGLLRSTGPDSVTGGRRDSAVLSIIREDWFGTVKQQLLQKIYPA